MPDNAHAQSLPASAGRAELIGVQFQRYRISSGMNQLLLRWILNIVILNDRRDRLGFRGDIQSVPHNGESGFIQRVAADCRRLICSHTVCFGNQSAGPVDLLCGVSMGKMAENTAR
jgi:hypothetical protein